MFFKKKEKELKAVVSGKVVDISTVNDPVFAQKMMGDGLAIVPSDNKVYAPCKAKVKMIFPTNHAVGLELEDGTEILIHIGIDTVNENGAGFKSFVKQDDEVNLGDLLIEFDDKALKNKGYDTTVMIIFTNKENYKELNTKNEENVEKCVSICATYK